MNRSKGWLDGEERYKMPRKKHANEEGASCQETLHITTHPVNKKNKSSKDIHKEV
ncbi:hypothetical protein IT6_05840 [Methylacidiphilum caldifontis]|uniref:hypothetical protein n=1 Tax=Methylacidiphilum caldifontis TaxID=2795386 RepID=UPI001A8CB4EE|nr:hypothetical protein [Methylacidiphilum caldifontis]QSR87926.1 hypothetical protein IT6_05840 [Methylacidiphilum caldifontis]